MIQRFSEWRNKFATTAVDVVVRLFEDDEKYVTSQARVAYVEWALNPKKMPFLFKETCPVRPVVHSF